MRNFGRCSMVVWLAVFLMVSACGGSGTTDATDASDSPASSSRASSSVKSSSSSTSQSSSSASSVSSVSSSSSVVSSVSSNTSSVSNTSSLSSSSVQSSSSDIISSQSSVSSVTSSSDAISSSSVSLISSSTSSVSSSADTVVPSIPLALKVVATLADTATVSWAEATDNVEIQGYEVARDEEVIVMTGPEQLSYIDVGLAANTPYSYSVRAVDTSGNRSAFSVIVEVTTPANPNACTPAIQPSPNTLTLRAKSDTCGPLGYAEYVPANYASQHGWPLIIALNGNGQTGNGSAADIQKIDDDGLPKEIKDGTWDTDKRFVVLAPQMNWQTRTAEHLDEFIQFAKANYRIDSNRIYLTALSGGGAPFYKYLEAYSGGEIAAAVPVATLFEFGSTPCKWKHVPFWLFYGSNDDSAQVVSHATKPYSDLKNCTPATAVLPRFTEYLNVGHNSWERTYNLSGLNSTIVQGRDAYNVSVYDWLLQYSRANANTSSSSSSSSTVSSVNSSASSSVGSVTSSLSSSSSSLSSSSVSSASSLSSTGNKLDPEFGQLTLIDAFHPAAPDARQLLVQPANAATTQTLLGRQALVLPPQNPHAASFAAFRLGEGRGLIPGNAYVLEFDYPDDVPRTTVFLNRGADLVRTVATGKEIGDYREQYAYPNPESLAYPHTGKWQTYRFFFYLHDRFQPLAAVRNEVDTKRPYGPADGFWVAVGHYNPRGIPLSRGAAVGEVRLYEVVNPSAANLNVMLPPNGVPHRRTFWREEMNDSTAMCQRGDSVVRTDPSAADYAGVGKCNPATGTSPGTTTNTWLEYKMRLSKVLGFNVFTKDLLEFGRNQGMDVSNYGGSQFYIRARVAFWPEMTEKADSYGLEVLPYFEYYGSIGDLQATTINCPGEGAAGDTHCANHFNDNSYQCKLPWQQSQAKCMLPSYGSQKHCEPLSRTEKRYTGFPWAEIACVDVSDPKALDDVKKLMAANVLDLKDNATFAGAWFRSRLGSWPISFTEETRARYAADRSVVTPTKAALRASESLRQDYYAWWYGQRKIYLTAIRDYLRAGKNGNGDGIPDANVLFSSYHEEGLPIPAANYGDTQVVTDDTATWSAITNNPLWQWRYSPIAATTWLTNKRYESTLSGMVLPTQSQFAGAGGFDEPGHGTPPADPQNYQQDEGLLMTFPYNRQYTVADTALLQKFSTREGLALIRHFPLNEDDGHGIYDPRGDWPMNGYFGYFVSDVERSTPYTMLAEVRAMAESDPFWLGYLSSNSFNTGAPQDLRRFNAAYLAWPALASTKVPAAVTNNNIVVRDIVTPHGKFVAIFNVGMTAQTGVQINFGATRMGAVASVQDRVGGQTLNLNGGRLTLDMPVADFRVFFRAN
jgi:hypothetical protein